MRKSPPPQRPPSEGRSEVAALLAASRALVANRTFDDAARAVLEPCKAILGAGAGLVAVRADGGRGFEVAVLDAGSLELGPAAGLPAPLRRLSARAVRGSRAVFGRLSNDAPTAPPGARPAAVSALVAPIVIDDEAAGLLGLIDKPGGFSDADCRLAEVFAEMAAVASVRFDGREVKST